MVDELGFNDGDAVTAMVPIPGLANDWESCRGIRALVHQEILRLDQEEAHPAPVAQEYQLCFPHECCLGHHAVGWGGPPQEWFQKKHPAVICFVFTIPYFPFSFNRPVAHT